ncbi:hypothetical protein FA95DRAFT_916016 [Auriscalpium vulgare]|uniref:Uncharacterized protein n=1 Tax=Auriscalpium vulgare TaxID=40419 RepID=A0ACB8R8D7_9AGAM|nr:hypothetical protein FA95DRAFT_916016 [Auriscalpium vulgare]
MARSSHTRPSTSRAPSSLERHLVCSSSKGTDARQLHGRSLVRRMDTGMASSSSWEDRGPSTVALVRACHPWRTRSRRWTRATCCTRPRHPPDLGVRHSAMAVLRAASCRPRNNATADHDARLFNSYRRDVYCPVEQAAERRRSPSFWRPSLRRASTRTVTLGGAGRADTGHIRLDDMQALGQTTLAYPTVTVAMWWSKPLFVGAPVRFGGLEHHQTRPLGGPGRRETRQIGLRLSIATLQDGWQGSSGQQYSRRRQLLRLERPHFTLEYGIRCATSWGGWIPRVCGRSSMGVDGAAVPRARVTPMPVHKHVPYPEKPAKSNNFGK